MENIYNSMEYESGYCEIKHIENNRIELVHVSEIQKD